MNTTDKKDRVFTISEWGRLTAKHTKPKLLFSGKTKSDFSKWQRKFKTEFHKMIGKFPESVPLRPKILERKEFKKYIREKVVFDSERFMSVPAWICIPRSRSRKEKFPAVLCCHGHGHGKDGFVGLDSNGKSGKMDYSKNLAIQLAENGYVVLAPDWRGFGERNEPAETSPKPRDLCNVGHLIAEYFGYNLLGLNVWDGMKAIDYLSTRKEVDISNLGCVGVSFGGTMTLFLSALDPRITMNCVSGYLMNTVECSFWGCCGSQTLPGLLEWGDRAEIGGLVCPRPMLIQIGRYDATFPSHEALKEYQRLQKIYRAAGAGEKLGLDQFEGCHEINAQPIIQWFNRWSSRKSK